MSENTEQRKKEMTLEAECCPLEAPRTLRLRMHWKHLMLQPLLTSGPETPPWLCRTLCFAISDVTMFSKVPAPFLVTLVASGEIPQSHSGLLWRWFFVGRACFSFLVPNATFPQFPDSSVRADANAKFPRW